MENTNIYFLIMKSDNPKIDIDWSKDWMLETTYTLQVGDIINFKAEKCLDNLLKDYKTFLFKITNRIFYMDTCNDSTGGIIELYISPIILP